MTYVEPMAVVDSRDDLLEVTGCLVWIQSALRDEVVEELPSFYVLENKVTVSPSVTTP